jgi:DNA gyrase subunit A
MGRAAAGVRGISLADEQDRVVGMVCIANDSQEELLVVSENGYGKRSPLEEYRITNRGGKGVRAMKITDKTGTLVTIKAVSDSDDLMIINKSGITIRMSVAKELRSIGRATQGVRLIRLSNGDAISSVAKVAAEDEKEMEDELAVDGSVAPDGQDVTAVAAPTDLEALTEPETLSDN